VSIASPLAGIPSEAVDLFDRLRAEAELPLEKLREDLRDHVARISAAAAGNEFLDLRLANALANTANALLDEAEHRGDHERRLVQAAVRYFLLDEDAEHDLESVCGLDDDAAVCNAVATAVGRDDLKVST
jgi:hypothetical protein